MKLNNFFKLVIAVAVSEMAGVIGAFFTTSVVQSNWYVWITKPALNPPSWLFGPVWTSLYFLIGISLYLVWKNNWEIKNPFFHENKKAWNRWSERLWTGDLYKINAISVFGVQYILNILWSYIFFGLRSPFFSLIEILAFWISIVYVIINFYRISKLAAYLLLPYLIWVSFATYLNYAIWVLN